MIEGNIMSMAELAKANKIKMILCSVLPANHFKSKPTLQPADSVIALNKWISAYAHSRHLEYVDFYSQMVDTEKGLKAAYTYDGLHPTIDGYKIMQPLVKAAISKIL
jgi:alpha-L-fucosidase